MGNDEVAEFIKIINNKGLKKLNRKIIKDCYFSVNGRFFVLIEPYKEYEVYHTFEDFKVSAINRFNLKEFKENTNKKHFDTVFNIEEEFDKDFTEDKIINLFSDAIFKYSHNHINIHKVKSLLRKVPYEKKLQEKVFKIMKENFINEEESFQIFDMWKNK